MLEKAGSGASASVFRAERGGVVAALKMFEDGAQAAREASIALRAHQRWGPAVIEAGTVPPGVKGPREGASYLALEWQNGEPLASVAHNLVRKKAGREKLAAIVAHGVGRALAELHEAGLRHGDVKPANIVVHDHTPTRDVASERGCTLIDLGLADVHGQEARGGTARYASPELRETPDRVGPESDLFALGVVLQEILDGKDPSGESEPSRWVEALLARAPGGRPSAAWVADRAARWLGLQDDDGEKIAARQARVRRTYLAVRRNEVATLTPLGPLERARWLVALVGTAAASWPIGPASGSEAELTARLLELARTRDPASWTLEEVQAGAIGDTAEKRTWQTSSGAERVASIAAELARPRPDVQAIAAAEDDVARGAAPSTIVVELAAALARAGESGRAWATLGAASGAEIDARRAELARRRGEHETAEKYGLSAIASGEPSVRSRARATLARLAWDAGDLTKSESCLEGARGPAAAEVRALIAYRRGDFARGLREVENALLEDHDVEASARLFATRGFLEHATGDAAASARSFRRAVELAVQAGAVVEEATYLTGEAAAATDAGDMGRALESATRAALLWERLGRRSDAARAWLSRASALGTIGASHLADEAAEEARSRALASGDSRAAAFACWAIAETRRPGDGRAREEVIRSAGELREASLDDRARAIARLLVWAPDSVVSTEIDAMDRATLGAPARWEWWGARAAAFVGGTTIGRAEDILAALLSLVEISAPLGSRGPALDAGARLAALRGDGEAARRLEAARRTAALLLRQGTPPAFRATLEGVGWARAGVLEGGPDQGISPGQIAQFESIVRSLGGRDRLRPLLEQVLDAMILWSGVERGLLLLRAPDDRLVARAARNLARDDLRGEQLALSQGIARRAMETGDAVVATDAFASLGDIHASVHALRLRSVLAVPLIARGETLGVVYLDDRVKRGAFGPRELAWVRLVASQAAMAIADARDQVLLKRAVRKAERAKGELSQLLRAKEAELDATRTELRMSRGTEATRFPYDAIAGRSAPMRAMLAVVDRVTASEIPILLVGESGTGKELIARAIHTNGPRSRRPFVSENCASVPESLLESTLFGHVKGAFTGASSTRAGLFDVADGGTLFLDEVGEMPLSMQAKLLRVLQDGEVRAVGGERTRRVNVRVIGATHRDLEAMVEKKTFREDLFYRLNVVTVRIPPLRERAEDIPLLVAHLLEKHAPDRKTKLTRAALEKLVAFPWPGNVRQLENEIRRAVVLTDDRIDVAELSAEVARGGPSAARGAGLDLRSRVDALEAELVREALEKTKGNQTRAAEILGLSRFGLQKMMKRLLITL
jgi:serine/threonine-protein kinase PknK